MYISLKKFAKQNMISRRAAWKILNNTDMFIKVDPLNVGTNKNSVNVYKRI